MGFNTNYYRNTNNIFNLKLKPNQFAILSYLIRMANEAENCYPSMNNIAEMCCVSKSTVVKTIEELEEAGYITVNTDSKYNVYVINYDVIESVNNRPERVKKARTKKIKSVPSDNTIEEKTDAETIMDSCYCTRERAEEALKYAIACKKDNPVGFAISAINENWELKCKESAGINPRSFNNFEGRIYQYDKLEAMLLGHEDYSEEDIHEVLHNKKNGNYTSNNSKRFNGVEIGTNVAV